MDQARNLTLASTLHSEASQRSQINRDFVAREDELGFYILCRGLSDDASGEFAAHAAGDTVINLIRPQAGALGKAPATPENCAKVAAWMSTAVSRASSHLHELGKKSQFPRGLSATCMCLVFIGDKVITAHVGNARAYLVRGQQIFQLGNDHSHAVSAPQGGNILTQPSTPSFRSGVLTRSLGSRSSVEVDTSVFDVEPGDTFLMCTDGLYNFVPGAREFASLLSGPNIEVMPTALVATARRNGSDDCATSVVLRTSPPVQVSREHVDQVAAPTPEARHAITPDNAPKVSAPEANGQPGDAKVHKFAAKTAAEDKELTALQRVKLFKELEPEELAQISQRLIKRNFHQGQMIISEGDNSTSMFVIVSGKVRVTRAGEKVATLLTGQHFGDMALLSARPRTASVDATMQSRCLELSRKAFEALAASNPALGYKLLHRISEAMCLRFENELNKRLPVVPNKPGKSRTR